VAKKKPTKAQELKRFRSDFAKLKKLGIVKPRDARSVKPTRHYKQVVKDNLSLLNGRQQAIKVSKTKATELRQQGYKVQNQRVILDKLPGQKVRPNPKSKYGFSVKDEYAGTTRLDVPPAETTNRRLQKFRKLKVDPDAGDQFYATIYGNQTLDIFSSQEELSDYLRAYGNNSESFAEGLTFYQGQHGSSSWYISRAQRRSKGKPPTGRKPKK